MSQLAYEWSVIDVGDIENIQEDENVSKYLLIQYRAIKLSSPQILQLIFPAFQGFSWRQLLFIT